MTVAEAVAAFLYEFGLTHAFGIVGGGNIHLWQAVHRKLNLISCHHEQAAVMASTAYYRTCGKLAPCIVTTGAGSTNALTGVMAAYMDSIPVLILSGNEASYHLKASSRVLGVQGYKSHWVAGHMCKFAEPAYNPRKVLDRVEQAIKHALTPRQGPAWVDIPKNIQASNL